MRIAIRTVLILAFLLVSAVTLTGLGFWLHAATLQKSIDAARERDLLIAKSLESLLATYHAELVSVFDAFAPRIAAGNDTGFEPIFASLHLSLVCVVDMSSGATTGSFPEGGQGCPSSFSTDRLMSLRELASGDGVSVSDLVANDDKDPKIYLVRLAGDRLVVGVVRAALLQNVLKDVGFASGSQVEIFDRSGRSMARSLGSQGTEVTDISTSAILHEMLFGENGTGALHLPTTSGDVLAVVARVEGPGWGIVVTQPLRDLESAAARLSQTMLAFVVIGLIPVALVALLIANRVERRIRKVAGAALKTVQGSNDVTIDGGRSFLRIRELSYLDSVFSVLATEIVELRAAEAALHADLAQARAAEIKRTNEFDTANQSLRDEITERKLVQSMLAKSEARFRNLFESETIAIREEDFSQVKTLIDSVLGVDTPEAFSAFVNKNPDFARACADMIVVVDANVATERLYGCEGNMKLLKSINKLKNGGDMAAIKKILCAIRSGETQLDYESVVKPADGQERVIMVRWSVASGYEKTYRRVLITSIDITERRIVEERLRQAQKMEAVGQLTGGVAHDFNNLLAVIAGNAELLADSPDVNSSLTDSINRAVRRGSELTQRLLAFSRRQPLRPRVIAVNALVASMSDLLARTLGETIELETISTPDLWEALADAGQVENALLNLAINARDAMPKGGKLSIECANVQLENTPFAESFEIQTGDFIVLSVRDTGVGMTPEVLEHACEPFFTTKEVGKGSGLGLPMVYGFAKQSGGNLIIRSEPKKGTTVYLFLPRALRTNRAAALNGDIDEIPRGRGETVLVIEDDEEVRDLSMQMLTSLGYRVVDVPDAATARKFLAKNEHVDIVLSDVILPGDTSGPKFAEEASAARPGLKIIFMSGYSDEAAARDGFLKSDCVLLSKPFERRKLATALRDQLDLDAA